jgi:hypothetical protein
MDALNVKLGVCKVTIDGTEIGHTIGGVEVTYSMEKYTSKVDQYTGPTEHFLIGETLQAKVPIAEFTLANINRAIPHGTVDGGKLTIGSYAGKRFSTYAKQMILHPIENDASDRSDDVVIWKAVCISDDIVIGHTNEGEKIIEAEFGGLVDESRADGSMLGLIGDSIS